MEPPPPTLRRLAEILRLRKDDSNPYNLLLTSTVSLAPEVLKRICGSNDWYTFCAWMQQHGVEDRIAILKLYLREPSDPEGYQALAQLVKKGYFSTVLTTNVDNFLENALFDIGVRSYEKLVIPRDTNEYVASTLERQPRGIRIVKLRGSAIEGSIPETFPEAFDLKYPLENSLYEYLNQDIVIVGSIEREDNLRRLLSYSKKKSIYYVTPQEPDANDDVVKAIRGRGNNLSASLVSGSYGYYSKFFKALSSILLQHSTDLVNIMPLAQEIQTTANVEEEHSAISLPSSLSSKNLEELSYAFPNRTVDTQPTLISSTAVEPIPIPQEETESASASPVKTKEERGAVNLMRIGIILLFTLAGIGIIFLIVSVFSNNTHVFNNPLSVIVLLVVVAAIILGAVGLLNAEQVTHLLSLGLSSAKGMAPDHKKDDEKKESGIKTVKE